MNSKQVKCKELAVSARLLYEMLYIRLLAIGVVAGFIAWWWMGGCYKAGLKGSVGGFGLGFEVFRADGCKPRP